MARIKDMTGMKFGRLTVVSLNTELTTTRSAVWKCECECGKEKNIDGSSLRRGDTKSCGCYRIEKTIFTNTTHGNSKKREYPVWIGMIRRCLNPDSNSFKRYGGRGIKVCERWRDSFENFYTDMGPRPPGSSIDRIDNDGDYEPKNCRWATWIEQCRNRRNNRLIEHSGKIQTLSAWAIETGIDGDSISSRLKAGWTVADALTTPPRPMRQPRP